MEQDTIFVGRPSKSLILSELVFMAIIYAIILTGLYFADVNLYINTRINITYICSGLLGIITLIKVIKATHTVFSVKYTLTENVLEIKHGLINIRKDSLELYRIKDITTIQPFVYRFYNLGNIIIYSTDITNPTITLLAIKDCEKLQQTIRDLVSTTRRGDAVLETI